MQTGQASTASLKAWMLAGINQTLQCFQKKLSPCHDCAAAGLVPRLCRHDVTTNEIGRLPIQLPGSKLQMNLQQYFKISDVLITSSRRFASIRPCKVNTSVIEGGDVHLLCTTWPDSIHSSLKPYDVMACRHVLCCITDQWVTA